VGVDLGDSVLSAKNNMKESKINWRVEKGDLTIYRGVPKDVVYCIGVLHHLKDPIKGFNSILENTEPGGSLHAWVYAHEGNAPIRYFVDPIRKIASKLPWWFTKYVLATLLVAPYFVYAKVLYLLPRFRFLTKLPLYEYSLWISRRGFSFFRHVAFDQLVTPQTVYIKKETIEKWLGDKRIDQNSKYIIFRNGNSWKFGGRKL
jgi:SAM-dependent methyltransferase